MEWLYNLIQRWELAIDARRESRLRELANSVPSFEWLLIRVGTAEHSRSPMLACREVREWFRQEFPSSRVVLIDEKAHVLFYE